MRSAESTKRYKAFLKDGLRADRAMRRSGIGFVAADVHTYLGAMIEGRTVPRPKPVRWRG